MCLDASTETEEAVVNHRILVTWLLWAALATCGACSSAKDRGAHWVNLVQRAHHGVDEYRKTDQHSVTEHNNRVADAAERAVRHALSEAPDVPNVTERWVIQDLYYRLAQLLADTGKTERAALEIERGLAVDAASTLARANLLALHGKVLEQLGNPEAAAKAYHAALLVNEVLMDQALSGGTERGKE